MLELALNDLKEHKVRTILTALGIFIAITAIVSLGSISTGVNELITSSTSMIGSDTIFVMKHFEFEGMSGPPQNMIGEMEADVVESISSHRPYRPALGIKKALEEISSKKNKHYDLKVVNACISLFYEKGFTLESDIPEENVANFFQMPA